MEIKLASDILERGAEFDFGCYGKHIIMRLENVNSKEGRTIVSYENGELTEFWIKTFDAKQLQINEKLYLPARRTYYSISNKNPITSQEISRIKGLLANINDWTVDKMMSANISKASNANVKVNLLIAKTMIDKLNISKWTKIMFLSDLHSTAIDILDKEQFDWEQIIESQLNQLPF